MIGEWKLSQLVERFGGKCNTDASFLGVSTDTRTLSPGDLFVALSGPSFDGHDFIEAALAKGAVAVVISKPIAQQVASWMVEDTLIGLGQIARLNRERFSGDVYAVTGSSGKTTVKEMLHSILSVNKQVLATQGNLNNHIGVPLTLLRLQETDQCAVIEQGASAGGEIAYTTSLSLPNVAILNNAMGAHLEGFGSLQGVVEAKGEIFSQLKQTDGTAIINRDDVNADQWLEMVEGVRVLTFSVADSSADLYATDIQSGDNGCYRFVLHREDGSVPVSLKVMGLHNVANAVAAATAVSAKKMPLKQIAEGLVNFTAVNGRMKPSYTTSGGLVVDDSYNANPGSVLAAVDLLVTLPGKTILVLGDMAELGADADNQHAMVGCRAAQKGVGCLWATGALSRHSVQAFIENGGEQGLHFATKEQLTAALRAEVKTGVSILIKGSRSAAMDQVVNQLIEGEK